MSIYTASTASRDKRLLDQSLARIAPNAQKVVGVFYAHLFSQHPSLRSMFPADMNQQQEKLVTAIIALVTHFDEPDKLVPALQHMGHTHAIPRGPGQALITIEHYAWVEAALAHALKFYEGEHWTPELANAWIRAYEFAAGTMIAAAALSRG